MPLSRRVTEEWGAHKTTCVILTSLSPSGRLSFLGQLVVEESMRVAIAVCSARTADGNLYEVATTG
jgi:hypothetical protein